MKRVLLAEDHGIVREGLRALLEREADIEVCGEAGDGCVAIELAGQERPDVAIVDISMPRLNGLEATRGILRISPGTAVVILTMHDRDHVIHEVLGSGAKGYVQKSRASRDVLDAVRSVAEGQTFFSGRAGEIVLDQLRTGRGRRFGEPLTGRERQVLQLIAEGQSTKGVAKTLGVSAKTADTHRTNIMRKLGVHAVTGLVRYAIRTGMVEA